MKTRNSKMMKCLVGTALCAVLAVPVAYSAPPPPVCTTSHPGGNHCVNDSDCIPDSSTCRCNKGMSGTNCVKR